MSFGDSLEGSFLGNAPFEINRAICHTMDRARDRAELRLFAEMLGFIDPPKEIEAVVVENPVWTPKECETCGKNMRPRSVQRHEGDGLVTQGSRGLCQLCYKAVRKAEMEAEDAPRKYGKPRSRVIS